VFTRVLSKTAAKEQASLSVHQRMKHASAAELEMTSTGCNSSQ
jgi:hypothetical protein